MNRPSADRRRVVIVGASAAGLRCASRLARLQPDWSITVVEQREIFSYAACGLPYLLSGDIDDAAALRSTADGAIRDPAYFRDAKGVDVRVGLRAVAVDTRRRTLTVATAGGDETELSWDELVLATGARARALPGQPAHPRVTSFHTLDDAARLLERLRRGELSSAVVIGAGPVGCELAEAFRALWGVEVTLIEAADTPLPGMLDLESGHIVARALEHHGVRLLLGSPVAALEATDSQVAVTAADTTVQADVAVVAVGVAPETDLASACGAAMGKAGGIVVDDRLATSVPHVWAVGDCTEVRLGASGRAAVMPLGSLANRQGRTLAHVLAGRPDRFAPVVGATAVKVFDLNVAAVGDTRAGALAAGRTTRSVWITTEDRAHYWPESEELAIQLVYEPETRIVVGVQALGAGDAVKRIDVAAQLIARGATLADLAAVEHAYAPAYAPAVEPLAVAAWVAENQEDGVEALSPLASLDGCALVDVRHAEERAARPLAHERVSAVELTALRGPDRPPLPSDIVAVCERGTRAAEAARLLGVGPVTGRYLGGGLRWRAGLKWETPR